MLPGLAAGRVQSPALRMICEREDEIAAFVPREYWTIDAELDHAEQKFPGKLTEFAGAKVEQFSFTDAAADRGVETALREAAGGLLTVTNVDRKQRRRNPDISFIQSFNFIRLNIDSVLLSANNAVLYIYDFSQGMYGLLVNNAVLNLINRYVLHLRLCRNTS